MALGDREGEADIRSAGEVFAQNGEASGAVVAILDLAHVAGASGPMACSSNLQGGRRSSQSVSGWMETSKRAGPLDFELS